MMVSEDSEKMGEMISLLKQLVEGQNEETVARKEIAQSFREKRPELEADSKSHATRLDEIRKEGEQRRREDQEFRAELLSLLRQLSDVLPQLLQRLDGIAESGG